MTGAVLATATWIGVSLAFLALSDASPAVAVVVLAADGAAVALLGLAAAARWAR